MFDLSVYCLLNSILFRITLCRQSKKKILAIPFRSCFYLQIQSRNEKNVHLNICFLSLHIHTASKGYQSTFLTFKQSFHIPTNFKKVCDILYFHTFWSNFHLMLKRDFWPPISLQCPRAVCRINAINACIVYICTSVFQFSNCRIFCFFLQAIYSRVARVCKKDHGGSFKFAHRWTTFLKAR